MSQMLGTCKVEIHSCTYVKLLVKAGEEFDYSLKCINKFNEEVGVKPRTVELFSTDPQLVYAPKGSARILSLL